MNYRELNREQKELIAKRIVKWLKKKGFTNDKAKMSVWLDRIQKILIEKKEKFNIEIKFDYPSFRSLFDIAYKDMKLFTGVIERKYYDYILI